MNASAPAKTRTFRFRGGSLRVDESVHLVGILNVSPDSFYDGGRYGDAAAAVAQARRLVAEGASLIDVGGQSTRPGYEEISAEEEIRRVEPVIRALSAAVAVPISVDTYKPAVAEAALSAGAHVINDVFGLQRDPQLAEIAARSGAGVIAMHRESGFADSSVDPVEAVLGFFRRSAQIAEQSGVAPDQLIVDPGIGFGKSHEQNLALIARLSELRESGFPVMLAASRKSVIGRVLDLPPDERLEGTLATTVAAVFAGAAFVRVHDVAANLRAARMAEALRNRMQLS